MQLMKTFPFLLATLLIFTKSFAQQDIDKTIMVDGVERMYSIHLPPAFDSSRKLPVIFAFHGGGGNYKQTVGFYKFNEIADAKGFIMVYPNAINKAWDMPGISSRVKRLDTTIDDVKFVSLLIDTLTLHYKANKKRIFATGISRGGMFSLYLADKLSDRIAGIAPVCASISQTVATDYIFGRPIPVLLINGTSDPLVKYNGGTGEFNKANEGNEDADMLPTEDLVKKIIQLNHCNSTPIVTNLPDINTKDGCTATESIYSGNNVVLDFIKVINGGHTWPGGSQYLPKIFIGRVCRDFNAAEKIISFFSGIN
jgi:polyhydroxybutyrate depolymerase